MRDDIPLKRLGSTESYLVWCTRPDLFGLVLIGRPTPADLDQLAEMIQGDPSDLVVDATRLGAVDPGILPQGREFRRLAFIVGGTTAELPGRVFGSLPLALAWLDEPHPEALAALIDELVAEATAGPNIVERLRVYLESHQVPAPSIREVSPVLGVSTRSLQRHLGAHGTSFRIETHRARLGLAQRLLLDEDAKIYSVAARAGFSTEANFIAFFRRATGVSPGEWRRGNRGAMQHP